MSKKKSNEDQSIVMKNSAVAVREALGVQEKHFDAPEQKWEDLEDIYQATAQSIVQTAAEIRNVTIIPGIKENIENKQEFDVAIRGLTKDIEHYTDQLIKIHRRHEGRTGPFKNHLENADAISIFDEYFNLTTQYKAVMLPTVISIMDHVTQASDKLSALLAKQNEVAAEAEINTAETPAQ